MSTIIKPSYSASSALTSTNLQSLASDSNLLAGWSSAVQDNTSNLYDDVMISMLIKMGTSPTVGKQIQVWAWSILDDTPTYPDTIDGTEATKTITSANILGAGAFKQAGVITNDSTTGRIYPLTFTLVQLFGFMPKKWGLFVVQNTGAALASSGNVVSIATGLQYQQA